MAIDIDKRTRWIGGGVAAAAIAGVLAWRLTRVSEPPATLILRDGAIEVRAYGELSVLGASNDGDRDAALSAGLAAIADHVAGRSRQGERLRLEGPILSDAVDGRWRTRFVLPDAGDDASSGDVAGATVPARRVAAIRLTGRASDERLASAEAELRRWLDGYGLKATGPVEHVFYPVRGVPAPLRRAEIWLPVASIY